MSDCGVCVYAGDPDGYPEFTNQTFPKARKHHRCEECNREVHSGEQYERMVMKFDGELSNFVTCMVCYEIRAAFSCDGVMYGSDFWESLTENFAELNESCFDKLTTPEAKKYLRERWMEWKGLKP